jgi:hypothetical protein
MVLVKVAFWGCFIFLAVQLHELAPETSMLAASLLAFGILWVVFKVGERIWRVIYFRWYFR